MPSYIVKLKAGVLFCLANEDRSSLAKEEKTLDFFNFEQLKVLVFVALTCIGYSFYQFRYYICAAIFLWRIHCAAQYSIISA